MSIRSIIKRKTILTKNNNSSRILRSFKRNCLYCNCPFFLKQKTSQRRFCFSCVKKRVGVVSNCQACNEKYLKFKNSKNKFCYNCEIGISNGIKVNCSHCHHDFYTNKTQNLKLKSKHSLCYSCYLVKNGVSVVCVDCNNDFYVDNEKKGWKIRCTSCYINNINK